MDYCGPRGISHDEFLGWSQSARDKAIWWMLRERKKCGVCQTRAEEWDPEQGGDRRAYRAQLTQCEGCIVIERAQESPEMSAARGMKVFLVRNEKPDAPRN